MPPTRERLLLDFEDALDLFFIGVFFLHPYAADAGVVLGDSGTVAELAHELILHFVAYVDSGLQRHQAAVALLRYIDLAGKALPENLVAVHVEDDTQVLVAVFLYDDGLSGLPLAIAEHDERVGLQLVLFGLGNAGTVALVAQGKVADLRLGRVGAVGDDGLLHARTALPPREHDVALLGGSAFVDGDELRVGNLVNIDNSLHLRVGVASLDNLGTVVDVCFFCRVFTLFHC